MQNIIENEIYNIILIQLMGDLETYGHFVKGRVQSFCYGFTRKRLLNRINLMECHFLNTSLRERERERERESNVNEFSKVQPQHFHLSDIQFLERLMSLRMTFFEVSQINPHFQISEIQFLERFMQLRKLFLKNRLECS